MKTDISILLAEDNEINQKFALKLLSSIGYQADLAVNGLEAIAMFKEKKCYDIVLMDIQMPLCDGFQAARTIRTLPSSFKQPIMIAVTANVGENDRKQYLEIMNDYVIKPYKKEVLASKISFWRNFLLTSSNPISISSSSSSTSTTNSVYCTIPEENLSGPTWFETTEGSNGEDETSRIMSSQESNFPSSGSVKHAW